MAGFYQAQMAQLVPKHVKLTPVQDFIVGTPFPVLVALAFVVIFLLVLLLHYLFGIMVRYSGRELTAIAESKPPKEMLAAEPEPLKPIPQKPKFRTNRDELTETVQDVEDPFGIGNAGRILGDYLDAPADPQPAPQEETPTLQPREPLANDHTPFYRGVARHLGIVSHEHQIRRDNSALVHKIAQYLKVSDIGYKSEDQVLAGFETSYGKQVRDRNWKFSQANPENVDTKIARCIKEGPQTVAELHIILDYLIATESGVMYFDWDDEQR